MDAGSFKLKCLAEAPHEAANPRKTRRRTHTLELPLPRCPEPLLSSFIRNPSNMHGYRNRSILLMSSRKVQPIEVHMGSVVFCDCSGLVSSFFCAPGFDA